MEFLSTATTWVPAPIANRSSVTVADRETIRAGFFSIVTAVLPVPTVTGNTGLELLPPDDGPAGLEPLPAGGELSELEQPAVTSNVAADARQIGVVHRRILI